MFLPSTGEQLRVRKFLNILVANYFFFFKVWINQGDIILVGLRDYQDTKADVIFKYTPDEARNLKTYGEFPESVRINDTVTFVEGDMDDEIEFDDYSSSDNEVDPVDAIWSSKLQQQSAIQLN